MAEPDVLQQIPQPMRRFDLVRYRFIEALCRRAAQQEGETRAQLDARIAAAIAQLQIAFARAQADATLVLHTVQSRFPEAETSARQWLAQGEFRTLHRVVARLERGQRPAVLKGLLSHFERADGHDELQQGDLSWDETLRQQEQKVVQVNAGMSVAPLLEGDRAGELKAMRQFRDAWARRVIDKAVVQAMEEAPEDAGPLNAHRLVIRAISTMQDISPEYLNRFVAYVDTLLWLERAASSLPPPAAAPDSRPAGKGKRQKGRTADINP